MAGEQPVDHEDILNKVTGGTGGSGAIEQALFLFRVRTILSGASLTVAQGRPVSLWLMPGQPSHGVAPGANRNPTNATDGSLKQASPSGGRKKWLVSVDSYGGPNFFDGVIYDRLADTSGLSGTSVALQTLNLATTRYTGTDAVGNQMFAEVYTAIGVTPQTLTVVYVDENGATQTTSCIIGSAATWGRTVGSWVPIPFAAGGRGVRSITSVQLGGSTGTAGDYGVTIARQIAKFGGGPGMGAGEDVLSGPISGPDEIKDDACLFLVETVNTTTAQECIVELKFLES